jgi:TorA maturation chaperone TorD
MSTTTAATVAADEVALSRAILYRLLSLACDYPTPDTCNSLRGVCEAATEAAGVIDAAVTNDMQRLRTALDARDDEVLERVYTTVFTMTTSTICPAYETAYTAKHLFQASEQMADVAGFYRAFGVEAHGERPDELAMELEFAYLLALKEAYALEHHGRAQVAICRRAERAFFRDHLGRWGYAIGDRMMVADPEGVIGAAGALLKAFLAWDRRHLRAGVLAVLPDQPYRPEEPGEDPPCMAGELAGGEHDEP